MLAMSKRTLMELMNDGELPTVRGRGRQGRSLRDDGGQGRPALTWSPATAVGVPAPHRGDRQQPAGARLRNAQFSTADSRLLTRLASSYPRRVNHLFELRVELAC